MKNTISSVIKDVIRQEHNNESKTDIDNLVQKIRDNVPDDVKLKTSIVENDELQSKIKETVGKILTDEEISSIVQLRNISNVNGKSITSKTTVPVIVQSSTESEFKEQNLVTTAYIEKFSESEADNIELSSSVSKTTTSFVDTSKEDLEQTTIVNKVEGKSILKRPK